MQKALFLDLQGTLGGDFLGDVRDFEFYPYALEALKRAQTQGYLLFIVTNQSRIAKGFLTWETYLTHEARIVKAFDDAGIALRGFYCCPHAKGTCRCKKPKPGLIERAFRDYPIDLSKSYVIGDMGISDMRLAQAVGTGSILVLTGGGASSWTTYRHTWADMTPDYVAENIKDAVDWLTESVGREEGEL